MKRPETRKRSLRISQERLCVLETSLDDVAGNVLAYAMERLLEAGALDAYASPLVMKKGRPGHLLTVLCRPADARRLADIVFEETPALGIRMREQKRFALPRRTETVSTPYGRIRVKASPLGAEPEYEDCAKAARHHRCSLREVMKAARSTVRKNRKSRR
jgi:hypothetical protein